MPVVTGRVTFSVAPPWVVTRTQGIPSHTPSVLVLRTVEHTDPRPLVIVSTGADLCSVHVRDVQTVGSFRSTLLIHCVRTLSNMFGSRSKTSSRNCTNNSLNCFSTVGMIIRNSSHNIGRRFDRDLANRRTPHPSRTESSATVRKHLDKPHSQRRNDDGRALINSVMMLNAIGPYINSNTVNRRSGLRQPNQSPTQ